jgi:hypothetical protein
MLRVQHNFHTALFRQTGHLLTARAQLRATNPKGPLKVLSFGCSIGEEMVTLRYLFPEEEIFGCDINMPLVDIAERSVGSIGTVFPSSAEEIAAHGPYDFILASAVLCLHPAPKDFRERFPVSRFDDTVAMLDANLNPGGVLVIINASYRFTESPFAARYDTVRSDLVDNAGFVDVFTRACAPYLQRVASPGGQIMRRTGDHVPRDDEDLADSIFQKRADGGAPAIHALRLAPPPTSGLVSLKKHRRLNTDWLIEPAPARTIEVRQDFDLCRVEGTDTYGYIQQTSWTSLLGEGFHVREPIWRPVPALGAPDAVD